MVGNIENGSPIPNNDLPTSASPPVVGSQEAFLIILNDTNGRVTVRADHSVTGLDEIPTTTRKQIAKVLLSEEFEKPKVLKYLTPQDSTLRAGPNKREAFRLVTPSREVVINDRPVFRWEPLSRANSYRVSVLDVNGHEIAKSDPLFGVIQWRPPTPLKRGKVFSWIVTATINDKEIVSPSASAPEVRFGVLSKKDLSELHKLRHIKSHLALGVFYANVGLIDEAEREFKELAKQNSQSPIPYKLLRNVRSLR